MKYRQLRELKAATIFLLKCRTPMRSAKAITGWKWEEGEETEKRPGRDRQRVNTGGSVRSSRHAASNERRGRAGRDERINLVQTDLI